jgi:hypothetical protein
VSAPEQNRPYGFPAYGFHIALLSRASAPSVQPKTWSDEQRTIRDNRRLQRASRGRPAAGASRFPGEMIDKALRRRFFDIVYPKSGNPGDRSCGAGCGGDWA